jgi:hypothetical protein
MDAMANLQVKNVPEVFARRVRALARRRGRTIRDVMLEALRRELERERWLARLEQRRPVEIGSIGRVLDDARSERERDLER